MNLSPRWVEALRRANIQSAHWYSIGDPKASDHDLMMYAAQFGYIVLTNDLDFGAILAITHGEKPSVVQIRSDSLDPDVIGDLVVSALRQLEQELRTGALLTIEPSNTRVRLLPLMRKE